MKKIIRQPWRKGFATKQEIIKELKRRGIELIYGMDHNKPTGWAAKEFNDAKKFTETTIFMRDYVLCRRFKIKFSEWQSITIKNKLPWVNASAFNIEKQVMKNMIPPQLRIKK